MPDCSIGYNASIDMKNKTLLTYTGSERAASNFGKWQFPGSSGKRFPLCYDRPTRSEVTALASGHPLASCGPQGTAGGIWSRLKFALS